MRLPRNSLLLLLSIATVAGADKDSAAFPPGSAAGYANHQTVSGLVLAAEPFNTKRETKAAFGKLDPNKHGILPILLVLQNDSGQALRLDEMRVAYIRADRREFDAIPPEEVRYFGFQGGSSASPIPSPRPRSPIPGLGGGGKKNPLDVWEIEGRAFLAKMLPPKEAAHGFFYFNTALDRGGKLLVTGIRIASSGQDLFFIEIPLDR